jgi:hypothetical protein
MQPLGPLRYSRSILRGYLDELNRLGLTEEVKRRASAELLPLLDGSLTVPRWLSAAPFDEIMSLVAVLRGREAVRRLGYSVMSDRMVTVLEPVMSLALQMFGRDPGSLFSRAHQMASVVSQGVEVIWAPSGDNDGTLRVRMDDPQPALSWVAWEGVFVRAIELAGHSGTVGSAVPAADGRSGAIDVSWISKTSGA